MKKLFTASNGEHFSVAALRTAFVFLIGIALASSLFVATAPMATAANMTPTQMIQSQLPQSKTMASATKTEFLSATCAAVKKYRPVAPSITKAAVNAHADWKKEILRTVITCLGPDDCDLIAQDVAAVVSAFPDEANALIELAIELAPPCRDAIGQAPGGGVGVFTNAPINQSLPPGTVAGGGGGGFNPEDTRLTVCDNGSSVVVLSSRLATYLTAHPGAFVGACVVTPATNR